MRQAIHQPRADRIAGSGNHGRQSCSLLDRKGSGVADRHEHIDVAGHQVRDKLRQAIEVPLRPASLEDEIAVQHVAMLGEAANEWGSERARIGQGCGGGE